MLVFGVILAGLCLLAGMVAWGMAARAESEAKSSRAAGTGQQAAGAAKTTPMIHLSEYLINPGVINAAVGDKLEIMNVGSMTHSLAVDGTPLASSMINPGGAAELTLSVKGANTESRPRAAANAGLARSSVWARR